jgi:hypothetical protein
MPVAIYETLRSLIEDDAHGLLESAPVRHTGPLGRAPAALDHTSSAHSQGDSIAGFLAQQRPRLRSSFSSLSAADNNAYLAATASSRRAHGEFLQLSDDKVLLPRHSRRTAATAFEEAKDDKAKEADQGAGEHASSKEADAAADTGAHKDANKDAEAGNEGSNEAADHNDQAGKETEEHKHESSAQDNAEPTKETEGHQEEPSAHKEADSGKEADGHQDEAGAHKEAVEDNASKDAAGKDDEGTHKEAESDNQESHKDADKEADKEATSTEEDAGNEAGKEGDHKGSLVPLPVAAPKAPKAPKLSADLLADLPALGEGGPKEADTALTRSELAQEIAQEAEDAALAANEADEELEKVEWLVLILNLVLSAVLYGGIWVARRDYATWIERKKELGRAWQAVQRTGIVPEGKYPDPEHPPCPWKAVVSDVADDVTAATAAVSSTIGTSGEPNPTSS